VETLAEDAPSAEGSCDDSVTGAVDGVRYITVQEGGEYLVRNNRLTVDDPLRQTLTMDEIEALKKVGSGSGKNIIAKIMESHSALDEKTAFSRAKYTLRKTRKYLRRFVVLPLDVSMLAQWMLHERDPLRIMEVREEMLGLIASWSNVHFGLSNYERCVPAKTDEPLSGRWLVVDDTGGLIVATLAERMGILHPDVADSEAAENRTGGELTFDATAEGQASAGCEANDAGVLHNSHTPLQITKSPVHKLRQHRPEPMSANSNTLTLIHSTTQPNISLLSFFSYDPYSATTDHVSVSHPLHTHLKTLTWLQLLAPNLSTSYAEPPIIPDSILSTYKSGKRGTYYRKGRRWACIKRVVDETRAGGFDGLIVASAMDPATVLNHAVPLLRGGAQVAVYSPNVEPLAELVDVYSSGRKTAFIDSLNREGGVGTGTPEQEENEDARRDGEAPKLPCDDFPVDPRLLLAPSLQTIRAREWQVLQGRTHPLMTSKGGAEGYLFTATRVLPADGKVEARGRFSKKRKVGMKENGRRDGGGDMKESAEVRSVAEVVDNGTSDEAS